MEHLLEQATILSNTENFEKQVNSREFEIEITKIASSYKVDKELKEFLIKGIEDNYRDNKKLSFVLFFIFQIFYIWIIPQSTNKRENLFQTMIRYGY